MAMRPSAHKDDVIRERAGAASPARREECVRMRLDVALDLMVCGGLLAGMSFLGQHLQADFRRSTLFAGLVGGGLCVLWGILGRRGTRCRWSAMGTLAAVACVFVSQVAKSWETSASVDPMGRAVGTLMMLAVAFCLGLVAILAWESRNPKR